ncbi:ATPase AAA-type core [Penicillium chermesinum]|uniref:ATPase AAA-type core n=1 Tax=Penicillium chermesinum TaxID=63820 RepID=A0A9W9TXR4_9EURO|nr:ATPase AAA-type core [Penicillium chermesinum]KAJ5247671.1 ATPase AAA-type core [Penicillium chermesinum]
MYTTSEPIGEKCDFKTYRHVPNEDGSINVDVLTKPFQEFTLHGQDGAYALVIHRYYSEKGQLNKATLKVNSSPLLKVFREVIGSYSTVPSDFKTPFELTSPFRILFHYWDALEVRLEECQDPVERMHLGLLFDFMGHEIGPERDRLLSMTDSKKITFSNAWAIFKPGDLVYAQVLGHPWLLRCEKTTYEENTTQGPYLELHCSFSDFDGTVKGQAKKTFTIFQRESFGGETPAIITDLPVYPRKFVEGQDNLEDRLIERGNRFFALNKMSVMAYEGQAEYLKEPDAQFFHPNMAKFPAVWLPYTESGRVIIDRQLFHDEQPSSVVRAVPLDADPMLCPPYQYGFSVTRKEWIRALIDCVANVEWKDDAWDSLIIGNREKEVLKALVSSHAYPNNPRNQTTQKGRGLVVLLHGSPGSGKTFTAETAAEGTKRALIMTSLGELNKEDFPWAFENRLRLILRLATLWNAIILMDEADVFLEARDEHGDRSSRNALVAVFLKELEYFGGIVFLTTNRIKSFDRAMKSRVHLALEYTLPGIETRRALWEQMLSLVPKDQSSVDPKEAIDKFISAKMNGREIANAVNTARTIARFEKVPLHVAHIKTVIDVWASFDENLRNASRRSGHAANKEIAPTSANTIIGEDDPDFES